MTFDFTVRLVCMVACGFVGSMALVRAFRRTDLYRWTLAALAAFALKDVYSQLSLLHEPLTSRTAGTLIACAVGVFWAALVLTRKPPPSKGRGRD